MNFKLDEQCGNRYFISYIGTNSKGETMSIHLIKCINPGGNNSLPKLWEKHGYINRELKTWWSLETYIYSNDDSNDCHMRYNPTIRQQIEKYKGKIVSTRLVLDFNWIFEATQENAVKLLNECESRFLDCY